MAGFKSALFYFFVDTNYYKEYDIYKLSLPCNWNCWYNSVNLTKKEKLWKL